MAHPALLLTILSSLRLKNPARFVIHFPLSFLDSRRVIADVRDLDQLPPSQRASKTINLSTIANHANVKVRADIFFLSTLDRERLQGLINDVRNCLRFAAAALSTNVSRSRNWERILHR